MSYGHADKLAGLAGIPATDREKSAPAIDPALYRREDVRRIMAERDIGALYRVLKDAGITQRQIAELTRQSQSEVSEILKGRRVRDVTVLERICDGLGIPCELMGLSYGQSSARSEDGAYPGAEGDPDPEVEDEMRRRVLLAATSLAALGRVVTSLGELAELALPQTGDEPLPSRLEMSHVQAVKAVTQRLRAMARQYGGQAEVFGAAAKCYMRWMGVPATDAVEARLSCALAELHTEAGWACYDSGVDGKGYFTRALRLAGEGRDGYGIGNTAWHAGASLVRSGHPNDALKCFQLGQLSLAGFQPAKSKPATFRTDDPRVPTISARLDMSSAAAYALMDHPEQARRALADAQESWQPCNVYESADKDLNAARIQADLGRFDTAEPFAATAARTFGEANRRDGATAVVVLAELHVRTGEPRGLQLAHHAVVTVTKLSSVRACRQLEPLAVALEARRSSDAQELARMARQVAATGA